MYNVYSSSRKYSYTTYITKGISCKRLPFPEFPIFEHKNNPHPNSWFFHKYYSVCTPLE